MNVVDYREVSGELIRGVTADSKSTHVELLRRRSTGQIDWRFRQQRPSLFWFRSGVKRLHLSLDGKAVDDRVTPSHNLAFFPGMTHVEGEFEVGGECDYVVVFLDDRLVPETVHDLLTAPLVAFQHEGLQRSLPILYSEVEQEDPLYEMFAEGWAMQAIALMSRAAGKLPERPTGGLPGWRLRQVKEFINDDLAASFSIEGLARVAGVSPRHFIRAFQQSTGMTPIRYVQGQRIERAKELLLGSPLSATEIALGCGFSHAQHFSNCFRRATGQSPSQYRRASAP